MVRFKFCPECASMQLVASGLRYECKSCGWSGIPKDGPADEINSYKLALKGKGTVNDIIKNKPENISFQNSDFRKTLRERAELIGKPLAKNFIPKKKSDGLDDLQY